MNPPTYKQLRIRKVGWFTGQIWEQIELPIFCRGTLLFTPCGGAPVVHRRSVITIHDAAVFAAPHGYSWRFRSWYKVLYRLLGRNAVRILTVSNFSKNELVRFCGIPPSRISVTYLGVEHIADTDTDNTILRRFNLTPHEYVLAVSSKNPNKNFRGLSVAFRELDSQNIPVAVAGGVNRTIFGAVTALPESVIQLGYVSDSELKELYQNAACFVFPSFYEGFGLPPLEALSMGCPVVVSDVGSLRELFGGIALTCDPSNPSDIADKVRRAVQGGGPSRSERVQFAKSFSWKRCAQETLGALREAVTAIGPQP